MRPILKSICIPLFLFFSLTVQSQSGWTKNKGEFFGKLDFARLSTDKYYSPNGTALITNVFNQNSINVYAEYGLHNRWTAILNAPIWRQNSFETTDKVNGIGDLRPDN